MLTPEQIAECRSDLRTFYEVIWDALKGIPRARNWHIDLMCEELERVCAGETERLIINLPPRGGKTELVIAFIAWCMGNWPDSEFMYLSYGQTFAEENTAQIKDMMEQPVYHQIFPQVKLRYDTQAKGNFGTELGGRVRAIGMEGQVIGRGAGKARTGDEEGLFGGAIFIDDPHKPDEANSRLLLGKVWRWFQNTLYSRRNSPKTPIIIIQQPVAYDDLSGHLLRGDDGQPWKSILIPGLTEDGKSFWEWKHPAATLLKYKEFNPYNFALQWQQERTLPGGNLIKTAEFVRYGLLPLIDYRTIYADTAQKTKEANDYSVFQCWGYGRDKRIYLIDQIRGKWEAPELKQKAIDFWAKHQGLCGAPYQPGGLYGVLRAMKVEDAASGTGLIQDLRLKSRIPIQAILRHKDKYTRLLDILGHIHSNYVCIPENAPFVSDFMIECESFTADDTHAHDDQVDPMIDAITDLLGKPNMAAMWENYK